MKKNKKSENYLEKIPFHAEKLAWTVDEKNMVTLHIENKGIIKRITQKLCLKPGTSHIHLDRLGSFVWLLLDGEKNLMQLAERVEEQFKEEAFPLYERLSKYFQILDSYHFIQWK